MPVVPESMLPRQPQSPMGSASGPSLLMAAAELQHGSPNTSNLMNPASQTPSPIRKGKPAKRAR